MSANFDAPKLFRSTGAEQPNARTSLTPRAERRRSQRWRAYVPVFVYGHSAADEPFHEQAYSAMVSDGGALLIMATAAPLGASLLLTNKVTEIEQQCRVVRVGPRDGLNVEVAVEFSAVAPQFWRLTAPRGHVSPSMPLGWHRKAR